MKRKPQATRKTPRYTGAEVFEPLTPLTNHERLIRYYQKRHNLEATRNNG